MIWLQGVVLKQGCEAAVVAGWLVAAVAVATEAVELLQLLLGCAAVVWLQLM